jgi:GNAT superfamily N-acetyltransferase
MIRDATIEDLKEIVHLGKEFFDNALFHLNIEYHHASVWHMLNNLRINEKGILLVAESEGKLQGMVGGTLFEWYFNPRYKSGQEIFWYVSPEYRGTTVGIRLLKEMERQAKAKGASSWIMISEAHMGNHDDMDKLYRKLGYSDHETAYIKDL